RTRPAQAQCRRQAGVQARADRGRAASSRLRARTLRTAGHGRRSRTGDTAKSLGRAGSIRAGHEHACMDIRDPPQRLPHRHAAESLSRRIRRVRGRAHPHGARWAGAADPPFGHAPGTAYLATRTARSAVAGRRGRLLLRRSGANLRLRGRNDQEPRGPSARCPVGYDRGRKHPRPLDRRSRGAPRDSGRARRGCRWTRPSDPDKIAAAKRGSGAMSSKDTEAAAASDVPPPRRRTLAFAAEELRLISALVVLMAIGLFLALPFVLSIGSVVFLPLVTAIILTIVLSPLADRLAQVGIPNFIA